MQFTRASATERPAELVWSDGGLPKPIPPEALSPRSMSPAAWLGPDFLTPLTIGIVWLWFATAVWLVARPFFAWYRRQLSEDEVRPVLAILALSLLLAGHGMSWGLPGGWAQDEIGTTDITGGLARWFVGGWYHRYPPLHFYLLALVHLPLIAADRLDMIDFWSPAGLGQAARIGRALSVAMSVGTAALVYLIGRTTLSIRAAVLASLWWVLVLTVAYYGKVTNLDMPYTFWFAVSLLGYVRALTRNAVRDYVLFAAGAAAAVCTKDQAYGLYLLPILHLIAHRVRSVASGASGSPAVALLRDPALPAAAAAGVLGFAVLQALPFNWSGLQQHFAYITDAGGAYRMIDSASASGQAFLFRRTFDHLVWSMSWPGSADCTRGRCLPVDPPPVPIALALLLPAAVVLPDLHRRRRVLYDRFMMPVCLRALDVCRCGARRDVAARCAAVENRDGRRGPGLHGAPDDIDQRHDGSRRPVFRRTLDSRPRSARGAHWRSGAPGRTAASSRITRVTLHSPIGDLPAVRPEMLLLTDNYLTRLPPDAPERGWYGRVLAGAEGYDVVLQHRPEMPFAILALEPRFRHPDGDKRRKNGGPCSGSFVRKGPPGMIVGRHSTLVVDHTGREFLHSGLPSCRLSNRYASAAAAQPSPFAFTQSRSRAAVRLESGVRRLEARPLERGC